MWTLGCAVLVHTEDMEQVYGLGLGLNSMEGREAKHISISKYCKNTAYSHRWKQFIQHKCISLIWQLLHDYANVSKQLLDEAEHDIEIYPDQGQSYLRK